MEVQDLKKKKNILMMVDHNNQTWRSPLVPQNMHYIYIQGPFIKV